MVRIACVLTSIVLLAGMPIDVACASEQGPIGVWMNEKSSVAVRLARCESGLCARIVWLARPYHDNGELRRDRQNPDSGKRQQPLCGLRIAWGYRQKDDHFWSGGEIYVPEEGETYSSNLSLVARDKLLVRAYIFLPLFGKTVVMHRTTPPEQDCPRRRQTQDVRKRAMSERIYPPQGTINSPAPDSIRSLSVRERGHPARIPSGYI
ncbi:MAG: DUF2147 domain-containing protein [Nitrococcus sp.]|nr:DUF2147 domain-containing protein [Nitrococcus sp.]